MLAEKSENKPEDQLRKAVAAGELATVKSLLGVDPPIEMGPYHGKDTLLSIAVKNGHLDIAKLLLEQIDKTQGDSKEFVTGERWALHAAAAKGDKELIKLVLNRGFVDINALDSNQYTALHLAAKNGFSEIVEILLGHTQSDSSKLLTREGTASFFSVLDDSPGGQSLRSFQKEVPIDTSTRTQKGETALHLAAREGHLDVLQLLIGFSDINAQDKEGNTPLHLAAQEGRVDILRFFMGLSKQDAKQDEKAVSANSIANFFTPNKDNKTAFELFVEQQYKAIENVLNFTSDQPIPPIAIVPLVAIDVVKTLFQLTIDKNKKPGAEKVAGENRVFILAAASGDMEFVQSLLKRGFVEPDMLEKGLKLAIYNNSMVMVKAILSAVDKQQPEEKLHMHGEDAALFMAVKNGDFELIKLLLDRGFVKEASVNECIEIAAQEGNSQQESKNEEGPATQEKFINIVNLLLNYLEDLNVQKKIAEQKVIPEQKETPKKTPKKTVTFFKEGEPAPLTTPVTAVAAAQVTEEKSTLQIAIENGRSNAVELLLIQQDRKANKDSTKSALQLAVEYKLVDAVKLLLMKGKNIGLYFQEGDPLQQALKIAVEKNHTEILNLILKHIAEYSANDEVETPTEDIKKALGVGFESNQNALLSALKFFQANRNSDLFRGLIQVLLVDERYAKFGSGKGGQELLLALKILDDELPEKDAKDAEENPQNQKIIEFMISVINTLVDHGADAFNRKQPVLADLLDKKDPTSKAIFKQIFKREIERGSQQIINFLLQMQAQVKSQENIFKTVLDEGIAGEPLLIFAVDHGQADVVSHVILLGAKIDALDLDGNNVLHAAIIKDKPAVVDVLLEGDQFRDMPLQLAKMKNKNGDTPLHLAVEKDLNKTAIEKLVYEDLVNEQNNKGETPLHKAAAAGNLAGIEILLADGANVKLTTVNEETALHKAAAAGKLECFERLLAHGADLDAVTKEGKTPLRLAVENNHLEIVQRILLQNNQITDCKEIIKDLLLKKGPAISPEIIRALTKYETEDALRNKLIMVEKLMDEVSTAPIPYGVRISTILETIEGSLDTSENNYALMCAITEGNVELVADLIKYDVRVTAGAVQMAIVMLNSALGNQDEKGAGTSAAQEIIDLLAETLKQNLQSVLNKQPTKFDEIMKIIQCLPNDAVMADIIKEYRDKDGNTLLHLAVKEGNASAVEFLLDHGFKHGTTFFPLDAKNTNGDTAAHLAVRTVRNDILSILLKPRVYSLGFWTDRIAQEDQTDFAHLRLPDGEERRKYYKADLTIKNEKGDTVLHEFIRALIEPMYNAIISQYGTIEVTKVLEAALPTLNLLLENRANINAQNKAGDTPLHLLAGSIACNPLKLFLMNHGAKSNIANQQGQTAIDLEQRQEARGFRPLLYPYIQQQDMLPPKLEENKEEYVFYSDCFAEAQKLLVDKWYKAPSVTQGVSANDKLFKLANILDNQKDQFSTGRLGFGERHPSPTDAYARACLELITLSLNSKEPIDSNKLEALFNKIKNIRQKDPSPKEVGLKAFVEIVLDQEVGKARYREQVRPAPKYAAEQKRPMDDSKVDNSNLNLPEKPKNTPKLLKH